MACWGALKTSGAAFSLSVVSFCLILGGGAVAFAHGDEPSGTPDSHAAIIRAIDPVAAMQVSKAAVGRQIANHSFVDVDGRPIDLEAFRGKPLIVSMVYTSCFHTCPLITENLVRAVEAAESAIGKNRFQVVTVGFDSKVDTPERLRSFGRAHGIRRADWGLLGSTESTIEAFAKDIGFVFAPSPRGFDHLAQTTVLDAEGKVYWQVYGEDFAPQMLVDPLLNLIYNRPISFSQPTSLWDRIRLVCTVYDPTQGRYRFSYGILIGLIIGAASIGGVGIVLGRWSLENRRRLGKRPS